MFKSTRGVGSRLLSIALTLMLVVTAVPLLGFAAVAEEDSGLKFDNVVVEYTYDDNGTEVKATDTLYAVVDYTGSDNTVVVPASYNGKVVNFVGDYAFASTGVVAVTLPDTIRGVGVGAFMDCPNLDKVIFGSNADSNDFGDFDDFTAVKGTYTATIGASAFANCSSLRHFAVYTKKPTETLANFAAPNAFAGCSAITFYGWGASNIVNTYYSINFASDAASSYVNLADVSDMVKGIAIAPVSAFMAVGETLKMTISPLPFTDGFNLNIYSYLSSNKSVVTVSSTGILKAVGSGVAKITVSSVNGYSDTCVVTVAERVEDSYSYRFLDDGTVEIAKFNSAVTGAVIIPATIAGKAVTSIGAYAFSNCAGIKEITLPDSVTSIGIGAFNNCTGLALFNVAATSNLILIDSSAFYGCSSLAFINLGSCTKLLTIGDAAFRNCTSLAAVILPSALSSVGKDVFIGDTALTIFSVTGNKLKLNTTIVYFDPKAPLTIYSSGNASVSSYASAKGIPLITTTDAVTALTWPALKTNLIIGETTSVSVDAVINSATTTDYLRAAFASGNRDVLTVNGKTITAVGAGTAQLYAIVPNGKFAALAVTVTKGNSGDFEFSLIDNMKKAEIVGFTNAAAESAVIPETVSFNGTDIPVTSIGFGAFADAASLKSITLSANVATVNGASFDCAYTLKEILVAAGNTGYASIDGVLYNANKTSLIKYPASKEGNVYTVPSGTTSLGDYAFKDNKALTYIKFPAKLIKIGAHCFESMEKLLSAVLPSMVSEIGAFAFAYDAALDYVLIPKATSAIGEYALAGSTAAIYGYKGFYAETYADLYELAFIDASLLVEVSEVRLSASSISLGLGDSYDLGVTIYPKAAAFPVYSLESADPAIATVDEDGKITAVAEGTTQIIVNSARGVYAVCTVAVVNDIPVVPVGVSSIEVIVNPDKMIYENGEALDLTGAIVYANYSDDSTPRKIISEDGSMLPGVRIRGYNPLKAGDQTLEIIFGETIGHLTVTVLERKLTGIEITMLPVNPTCVEGMTMNSEGLVVTAFYNNGQQEAIADTDYTMSAAPSKVGTGTITVTYGGFTDTFTVTVIAKSLASVKITTAPLKANYIEGEELDTAGLIAVGTYNNGTTVELRSDVFTYSGFDKNVIGEQTITATYTDANNHKFFDVFKVTVTARTLVGIEIVKQPNKQVYIVGEKLDITGMVVWGIFDNGTHEVMLPKYEFELDQTLSIGETSFTLGYKNFTDTFKVLAQLGNYQNEFSYRFINNGTEIEIVKVFPSVASVYTVPSTVNGYPVTSIGVNAFKNNNTVTKVTVPSSVKTLGTSVFAGCDSLKTVDFKEGITAIPDKAFFGCDALSMIILPESVTSIGELAFANCSALLCVAIPSGVTIISSNAFENSNTGFTILGNPDTCAQFFAIEHKIKFKAAPLVENDLDGNGTFNVSDARQALRIAAEMDKATGVQIVLGDKDATGDITISDARQLLREVADIG